MKRLVVGILAHVDSGKTTLSEAMLYCSGNIKKLGRVDHKNAFLDTHNLERDRGITIFSKQAVLQLEDTEFTLLDTPGHVDFSTEMERTLQVLDYAILVISGTDGVQSHTRTLWRLLKSHNIPTFIFVNKMDLSAGDKSQILDKLKDGLSVNCVDFSPQQSPAELFESIALTSENMLEEFLQHSEISTNSIIASISSREVFPCFFGSALKLDNVEDFLNELDLYTKSPTYSDEFGAKIFKIARDELGNRLTYLKITGGELKVKTILSGVDDKNNQWNEKINQIRVYSGVKFSAVEQAYCGMICAVTGLNNTLSGDGLGVQTKSHSPTLKPVLTYRVNLSPEQDAHIILTKLKILQEEDPQLYVVWNEILQEIHVQLMGEVQLEVLGHIFYERFNMSIEFGQGNILYKETIDDTVEGVGHFEPLRHYSEVHLLLEPLPRGSGMQFSSDCSEDDLDKNWQHLILTHLEEKSHIGILTGSPITDVKITLVAGKAHLKHTEGGDFRQATYRAVRHGLRQTKSILLEPWYNFYLEVPSENIGRAMSDLQRMNGNFSPPEMIGNTSTLTGSVPVATFRDYQVEVTSYTKGLGRLSCTLKGYETCHNSAEIIEQVSYDCDADTVNTADSVFCAHGAGFNVKWDEVTQYMHIEPVLKPKIIEEIPQTINSQRSAAAYYATLAQDKELMAIFERTYGKIDRDPRAFFQNESKPPAEYKFVQKPQAPYEPEYLLIDGYNIIFAWDELKSIAQENLDTARYELINILTNYRGYKECELIVVFDAYKVRDNLGEVEKRNNITVVYTKEAETADMYIEKVTRAIGKKRRVRVATSDGLEQLIIMGHGAMRVSAEAFHDEVKEVEATIRGYLEQINR